MTVQACNLFCVGVSLNRDHVVIATQNGYVASTRENQKTWWQRYWRLERLVAGLDRKWDKHPDIIRCW
jgi:hypothetical protein